MQTCAHAHTHIITVTMTVHPVFAIAHTNDCTKKPAVNCNFAHTYGNYMQITEMHIYEVLTLCMSIQVRDQAVRVVYGNSYLR